MGKPSRLAADQLDTLARLSALPELRNFYLAGGSALAVHLGHRTSRDLDLFSLAPEVDFDTVRATLVTSLPDAEVISITDASLHLRVGETPLDVVRYPYALLEPPRTGPSSFPIAGLLDLSTMKLAAAARRGIRRDFWDLHELFTRGGLGLGHALDAYVARFGVRESDLYHVLRALTYFDDARREHVFPQGLDEAHWRTIESFFTRVVPAELSRRAR